MNIILTVREDPAVARQFIADAERMLEFALEGRGPVRMIVIDREGGEALRTYASCYEKSPVNLYAARCRAIELCTEEFTLICDLDTRLPHQFVSDALNLLEKPDVAVVTVDYLYPNCQGHYAFGASMWKTQILKQLYNQQRGSLCECLHMWNQVRQAGFRIETLERRAIHLRGKENGIHSPEKHENMA